jgi:putative glutamine amidotransferase
MRSKSVTKRIMTAVLVASLTWFCVQKSAFADDTDKTKNVQKRPLIGINVDVNEVPKEASVPSYYFEAIEKSGGIPILLPPMKTSTLNEVLKKLDGLLLIGGADYPPVSYGAEPESKTNVMSSSRAEFDLSLVKAALNIPDLPILGICAGCQLLNITEGGSLVQDIPSKFPQSKVIHGGPYDAATGPRMHEVSFSKNSLLDKLYCKASLSVPTSHHQCLGNIASDMKVVARTSDGLPEAIEKDGSRFIVGVQWHPERDFNNNKALFAEFIRNAQNFPEH